jgi:uncharacterized protein YbbK (DUF523 family)
MTQGKKLLVGVSSCLLGNAVRYDGTGKWDACINDLLSQYFEFVPFCPEVAIGMGVPRPPIRLVQMDSEVRAIGVADRSLDVSDLLRAYGKQSLDAMRHLRGFIFKARSPSCGIDTVPLVDPSGMASGLTSGLFASEILCAFPNLPIIDEGHLQQRDEREDFIARVFEYDRIRLSSK